MAEFLVTLADFDHRRGWELLGHASLFAFLISDLPLSKSAAYYRKSAAQLLQGFPEVVEPLRDGRLCLSTIGELSKVLTEENRAVVAPRFYGLSSREAQEVVAELQPRQVPSTRMVVTRAFHQSVAPRAGDTQPLLTFASAAAFAPESAFTAERHPDVVPLSRVPTPGIANGGGDRLVATRDQIVPLTADLRRVHFNVGKQVVKKLEAAREGLSHAIRGATMEQVLEVALDLLLEKQARARGLVKRPRSVVPNTTPSATPRPTVTPTVLPIVTLAATPIVTPKPIQAAAPAAAPAPAAVPAPPTTTTVTSTAPPRPTPTADTAASGTATATPTSIMATAEGNQPSLWNSSVARPEGRTTDRRSGHRETIPAAVRRAVWERDAGRCTWPLDSGGCCGSTRRLELDHRLPWAHGGSPTVEGLRLLCAAHNRLAARQAFGARCVGRYARRTPPDRARRPPTS